MRQRHLADGAQRLAGPLPGGHAEPRPIFGNRFQPRFRVGRGYRITVNVGSTVHVDIHMALEQLHSEIEVTAALVDTMLPASDNIVESDVFAKLPINGPPLPRFRAADAVSASHARRGTSLVRGAARHLHNVTVDGTDYNQAFFGGIQGGERAGSIITVPQSAVQEFQAITSGFYRRIRPHHVRRGQRFDQIGKQ